MSKDRDALGIHEYGHTEAFSDTLNEAVPCYSTIEKDDSSTSCGVAAENS